LPVQKTRGSTLESSCQSIDGGEEDPVETGRRLLETLHYRPVVAMTGPVDVVTDGTRVASVFNNHDLVPRVVAGCRQWLPVRLPMEIWTGRV